MEMTSKKREFVRQLRRRQTSAESKVWRVLRNNQFMGLKFRRQHLVEGFVVDFYCSKYKLVIEIDGGIHDKRKEYDLARQEVIESKFNTVIRIRNEELGDNCSVLLERIKEVIS